MGCVLTFAYWRLSLTEEKTLKETSKDKYNSYAKQVPRFLNKKVYKIFRLPKGNEFHRKNCCRCASAAACSVRSGKRCLD
jgi:hypothetical protein